jgi:hypothetical protein
MRGKIAQMDKVTSSEKNLVVSIDSPLIAAPTNAIYKVARAALTPQRSAE